MFKRKTEGSIVCPSCGLLVGVNDEACFHCGRRNPGMWGFAQALRSIGQDLGLLPFVLYGSVLMYVITLAWDPAGIRMGGLTFFAPSGQSALVFGASGADPVFRFGRWWTVLSATFLHGGLIHIFFNMYWARTLIPATTQVYGASRSVIIYTTASIVGFSASTFMFLIFQGIPLIGGGRFTLGASASIFGLLGALYLSGGGLGRQAGMYAIFLGVFGLIFPGVDNWAHAGGFAGGYLAARWMNPSVRETQTHLFIALGCMAAFVLSILWSVLTAYGF